MTLVYPTITIEEYVLLEQNSEVRHEYHHGRIVPMTGGTVYHSLITGNIYRALWQLARAKGCTAFAENMSYQVSGKYAYYPDVLVTCEALQGENLSIIAPCVVVEVLSDSTRLRDFSHKLPVYLMQPCIHTVLYIEQSERKVYAYQREQQWLPEEMNEGEISIACLGAGLSFDDIYQDVAF